jgi:hypothetical protein
MSNLLGLFLYMKRFLKLPSVVDDLCVNYYLRGEMKIWDDNVPTFPLLVIVAMAKFISSWYHK